MYQPGSRRGGEGLPGFLHDEPGGTGSGQGFPDPTPRSVARRRLRGRPDFGLDGLLVRHRCDVRGWAEVASVTSKRASSEVREPQALARRMCRSRQGSSGPVSDRVGTHRVRVRWSTNTLTGGDALRRVAGTPETAGASRRRGSGRDRFGGVASRVFGHGGLWHRTAWCCAYRVTLGNEQQQNWTASSRGQVRRFDSSTRAEPLRRISGLESSFSGCERGVKAHPVLGPTPTSVGDESGARRRRWRLRQPSGPALRCGAGREVRRQPGGRRGEPPRRFESFGSHGCPAPTAIRFAGRWARPALGLVGGQSGDARAV